MPKKPAADGQKEAMAKELNPRGLPYRLWDLEFPPGEWVAVTEAQAVQLDGMDWAKVRAGGTD